MSRVKLEALRDQVAPQLSEEELRLVERAARFAEEGHAGQTRADGTPYFEHPVAVAGILGELGMPGEVLAAGLLHDVVEDNPEITVADVEREFGSVVSSLVDGVTKLTELPRVSRAGERDEELSAEDKARLRQAESLRKTILAMHNDVRVVLVKLADRLHNMRTLGSLRPEKQRRIARESLEIFAPLANRLGIWQLKWQLEDLSLRYLDPDQYREISRQLAERRTDRERVMAGIVARIEHEVSSAGIEDAVISGRPKHLYSIYRKMQRKRVGVEAIYDIRAVRIFVADVSECYGVLGIVHSLWRPIPGEFDDYIAAPKENFYQSLHTAVVFDDGKTLEIQIRTHDMHRHAEYGIASHWRYKEGGAPHDEHFQRRLAYLRATLDWHRDAEGHEFVDAIKSDVLLDRVYVFTPKGDIVDLPEGSTPLDFAYHIHTEVGHRCRGARVNGRIVSLSQPLANGDRIEILTVNRGGPSRDWLNQDLGFVVSSRAREKIRTWFRQQDRGQHLAEGKSILERELKRLRLGRWTPTQVAEVAGIDSAEELLVRLGRGDLHGQAVIGQLVRHIQESTPQELPLLPPSRASGPAPVSGAKIRVGGMSGMLSQVARCCSPVPGDPIIGYTTRGRGVVIHRQDCRNMLRVRERERLISVEWGDVPTTYPVALTIVVYDREGLLSDIAGILADEKINVRAVDVPPIRSHRADVNVTVEVSDLDQLLKVMNRIEQLPNVVRVERSKG